MIPAGPISSRIWRPALLLVLSSVLLLQHAAGQDTGDPEMRDACDPDLVDWSGALGRSFQRNGQAVYELTEPVLLQCTTELTARFGIDEGDNRYRFEGDVRVVERGDTVYADNMLYFSDSQIGEATGNVLITDGRIQLTAPEALYFSEEKRTVFNAGVQFQDSSTVLTSNRGTYWSDEAIAEFNDSVVLLQDSLEVRADSLTYWRYSEDSFARGDVYVERRDGDILKALGRRLYHAAGRDSTHLSGDVDLLQVLTDDARMDSLFVRSDDLFLAADDSASHLLAVGNVGVVRGGLSVAGDTLTVDRDQDGAASSTRMTGTPIAWLGGTQISSEVIRLTRRNGILDSLQASRNVFVAQEDTLLGRIQQLKGRMLEGVFENDSLRLMTVAPNAEALYYVEAEEDGEQAAVFSTADRIVFVFEGGEVADVRSYDGIDGALYPSNIIDQAQDLDGFSWRPEDRPLLEAYRSRWLARLARLSGRNSP